MFETIKHIIRKEFIQTFRDKRMLFPIFAAPLMQLILFGYAVTTDVKNISLGVLDLDRSQVSRSIISSFEKSEYFQIDYFSDDYAKLDELLKRGQIKAAAVIPPDFAKKIQKGAGPSIQILLDGSDANTATIIQSYIAQLMALQAELMFSQSTQEAPEGFIITRPRIWYNPELKSSVFMVPGVISLILLLTTLILTSLAITREREMGTLEQLIVSPIKPWELIIGKTVPFVIIGIVDIILIIFAGKLIFDVPIKGSLLLLFGISFLFILTTLSVGLFISTVSTTQQQAFMTSFFVIMPAMLLSGIFTPIESMPRFIQYITYLNPLRYFSYCVRAVLLKGNDLSVLWPQVAALAAFGIIAIILSSIRFKKNLG